MRKGVFAYAYCKNWLLVGAPSYTGESGAWLYNLNRLDEEPEKLTLPDVYIGKTVAVNEHFAAVGDYDDALQGGHFRIYSDEYYEVRRTRTNHQKPITLVKALDNGSTTTIHSRGKLSLSGNVLGIMNPYDRGLQGYGTIEARLIDNRNNSNLVSLIAYEDEVTQAFVQNGFLFTIYDRRRLGYEIWIREIDFNFPIRQKQTV